MELQVRLIPTGDTTEAEIDRAATAIRAELERVSGVESVHAIAGPPPTDTKSSGLADIGAFLVDAKPAIELLTAIINLANTILKRAGTPAVKLQMTRGGVEAEFDPRTTSPAEVTAAARRLLPPPG